MNNKIKVFLADDHHIFREGIRILLENDASIEVVAEGASGTDVLSKLKELDVDIILLDINMPKMSGIDIIGKLKDGHPDLKIIVFSSHDDEQYVYHMMKNGAKGYILKSCRKNELITAIKRVNEGDTYLSSRLTNAFFDYMENKEKEDESPIPLTRREIEILKLVAKGHTNLQIGEKLYISHRTVDTHRRNMMTKLGLRNAAALTNYAAQNGLLDG